MLQLPHPDAFTDWQAFKELKCGGRQAAEDVAMEAMWQALEQGRSKEEAEKVFNDTYKKVLNDSSRSQNKGH